MSSYNNQQNASIDRRVAAYAQEVTNARQLAINAMFEFDYVEQMHNISPGEFDVADLDEAHWEFQRTIVLYLTYLKPYLTDEELETELNEDGESVTFDCLLKKHGETTPKEVDDGSMTDPDRTAEIEVPVFQAPNALRNAVHTLNDLALKKGFLPQEKTYVEKHYESEEAF